MVQLLYVALQLLLLLLLLFVVDVLLQYQLLIKLVVLDIFTLLLLSFDNVLLLLQPKLHLGVMQFSLELLYSSLQIRHALIRHHSGGCCSLWGWLSRCHCLI